MSKELVYVVWEECRGMGETMLAVFTDEERAKKWRGKVPIITGRKPL